MQKRLFRSRKDKMISGVAGGIAEYFDVDPTLIRILFVVTLFLGGSGILAYIILWIVIPEEPVVVKDAGKDSTSTSSEANADSNETKSEEAYKKAYDDQREKRRRTAGGILLIIGTLFLVDNMFPRIHFGDFWPLILIGIGAGLLINSTNHKSLI
jgi:phage shock protein C